jgi:hypothetical protein
VIPRFGRFGARTLLALGFATASACSLLGPDLEHLDALYGQTAPEAGRACVPARPPGAPDAAAAGSDRSFVTVFSTLGLLPPADPRGFDLDDRCTCPEPASCRGDPKGNLCDPNGGIDNKLGTALQEIPAAAQFVDPAQLRQHFAQGQSNVIFDVTGYNGTANDDSVDVYLIRSTGTPKAGDTGDTHSVPKFNGADAFDCVVDDVAACSSAGIVPALSPQRGYVRDQLLVVPDVSFTLSVVAGYPIRGHGVLQARIEAFAAGAASEQRYALRDGIVAGALPVSDLVTAIALIELSPGVPLCSDPSIMSFIETQLCLARDSTFAPAPGGDGASCDAVSAAFSFEAVPFVPHDPAPLPPGTPCAAAAALKCD